MSPLFELLVSVVRSYPGIFANPMVDVLYLVVLGLVGSQYSRIQFLEEKIYGNSKNRAFYHTVMAIGLGLVGGLFASMLLVLVGVSVTDSGIAYLFPIALLLYLISPRLLCYSYAGGLVGISYLVFGWPKVNVPAITALVACLHLAESFLIRLSGYSCATPLYVTHKNGRVVGAFGLQRFWPIPLTVLFLIKVPDVSGIEGLIHMPDWWPLIQAPPLPSPGIPVFTMIPVVAALGYSDLAIARSPREKSASTSKNLLFFSITLLLFSIAASRWSIFSWVAALFSPLGHELVIKIGNKAEFENKPYYVFQGQGVMVLDVFDRSPAQKAGLKSGDIICSVQGSAVKSREDIEKLLETTGEVSLTVKENENHRCVRKLTLKRKVNEPLGIITVPQSGDQPVAKTNSEGILLRVIKRLINKTARLHT